MLNIHCAKSCDFSKSKLSFSSRTFSKDVLILHASICRRDGWCIYRQCGEQSMVSGKANPKVTSFSPSKYNSCSSPSLTMYRLGSVMPYPISISRGLSVISSVDSNSSSIVESLGIYVLIFCIFFRKKWSMVYMCSIVLIFV